MFEDLFYQRLSKLRMDKGVSARDMSLSIGQSAGYINSIENKNGFPSLQVFFYICEYLGVTPSEFFDEGNNCPKDLQEIINDLQSLDSEYIKNIKAIIKGLKNNKSRG